MKNYQRTIKTSYTTNKRPKHKSNEVYEVFYKYYNSEAEYSKVFRSKFKAYQFASECRNNWRTDIKVIKR